MPDSPASSGSPILCPAARPLATLPNETELRRFIEQVRPYTMVTDASLLELARQVCAVLMLGLPGHFVECGVWRGGAAFLIAEVLRAAGVQDRKIFLCDSFAGLPPPQELDGAAALAYAADPDSPSYHDNCAAALAEVQNSATQLGLSAWTEFVEGWFDQSLPLKRVRFGPIALLRIDADWYSSVRCCLENLYDQVVDGGFVVFDDYFTYDGCALAVHEFLGQRRLAHRLESLAGQWHGAGASFRKGNETWLAVRPRILWPEVEFLREDLSRCISQRETFIFVDDQQLVGALPAGWRAVPFLERGGVYWGPPENDETAIRELERMRQEGAGHIVFAWPSFWWLQHYHGFHQRLRACHRCVLENERLVVFALNA